MKVLNLSQLVCSTGLILQSVFLTQLMHHSVHALPCSTDSIGVWNCVATVATVATALLPSLQLSWGHQQFGRLSEQQIHSIVRLRKLIFLRHGRRLCWRPRCKQGDTEKKWKKHEVFLEGNGSIECIPRDNGTLHRDNFLSSKALFGGESYSGFQNVTCVTCDLCDLCLFSLFLSFS